MGFHVQCVQAVALPYGLQFPNEASTEAHSSVGEKHRDPRDLPLTLGMIVSLAVATRTPASSTSTWEAD